MFIEMFTALTDFRQHLNHEYRTIYTQFLTNGPELTWKKIFVVIPRKCALSRKVKWLTYMYKADIKGIGIEFTTTTIWLSPPELTLLQLVRP